jgi:redox-sensitive bicupin YhaK (pirin superfamily)
LFSHDDKFWIKAADQGVRFILLSAKPLKEPIAWGGPIVMNTEEKLNSAFKELDNNTFIKII